MRDKKNDNRKIKERKRELKLPLISLYKQSKSINYKIINLISTIIVNITSLHLNLLYYHLQVMQSIPLPRKTEKKPKE